MTAVAGKVILNLMLVCIAFLVYRIARRCNFTVDQSLLMVLINLLCTLGSWHPW